MDKIKKFLKNMLAAASIMAAAVMLCVGYSYRLNPQEHPVFANIGLAFPLCLVINGGFLLLFLLTWKRLAAIPLLGFVACYIPVRFYAPLNIPRPAPDDAIKVMSYNVFTFNSGDTACIRQIGDYISGSGAAIVCLQEAAYNYNVRDALMKEYQHIDTMYNVRSGELQIILSKYPILSKTRVNPQLDGCLCGAYEVLIDGVRTTVVNCHFEVSGLSAEERQEIRRLVKGDWQGRPVGEESKRMIVRLGEAARRRVPQVEGVLKYIESRKGEPLILMGDFNDHPVSYCHWLLSRRLTDCYTASGNGPGISYHYNNIYVRIDNVMCSADWHPYAFTVDRQITASDHYPIWGYVKKSQHYGKKRP